MVLITKIKAVLDEIRKTIFISLGILIHMRQDIMYIKVQIIKRMEIRKERYCSSKWKRKIKQNSLLLLIELI